MGGHALIQGIFPTQGLNLCLLHLHWQTGSFFLSLLYNIVLVLPYINMNPPWVYMCSPSWPPLPPPSRKKPPISLVCVFFQKYYMYTKPCMYIYSSSSFLFLKHKWKQTEHMVLFYVLSFLSLNLGNCSACVHKGTSSFLLPRCAIILLYGLLQFIQ